MYQVMIVDDETIIRTTLHTMIAWEEQGYEIVADAQNGEQAWHFLQEHVVDVLITDIKMPIMDGLTLIQNVKNLEHPPVIIVLSGYNDFDLVRKAFLLGSFDYLLKSDISNAVLSEILAKVTTGFTHKNTSDQGALPFETTSSLSPKLLADMVLGKTELQPSFFHTPFLLAQLEIDHFQSHLNRFGSDLENSLIRPMINFAMQIPRVASRCKITELSASRYLLYYEAKEAETSVMYEAVSSICRQITSVWGNYMNIPVSIGISSFGNSPDDLARCYLETVKSLSIKYLYNKRLYLYSDNHIPDIETIIQESVKYECFRNCIYNADEQALQVLHQTIFSKLSGLSIQDARHECLYIVYSLSIILKDSNNDLWTIFDSDIDYEEKISRLDSVKGLELWINNYLRFIMDYMEHHYDRQQADLMERAKRFIRDNYASPEMSLGKAAGFVGLSEKYFSSRFTKEVGNTFSNYLTEIRMEKAKKLLSGTDMKMYEISESIGYNNVEHFTRVFKKECEISPSSYKKEGTPKNFQPNINKSNFLS